MTTEDRDQIVAQLRQRAEDSKETWLHLEEKPNASPILTQSALLEARIWSGLHHIFSTLRTE